MATPRINSERARKLHEGIEKVCTNCKQAFYDCSPQKKYRKWCDNCIRKFMSGEIDHEGHIVTP